jgi:uncharacterized protein (TIGR02466 family)
MAVKLMHPTYLFHTSFLHDPEDKCSTMTEEYFGLLKNEMDAMRKRDTGRNVSNQEKTSWQSNDGVDQNPIFIGAIRQIKRVVRDEVMPFFGARKNCFNIDFHNSWANINGFGAWNSPHLHNGCFYSGAMYIHADGDEGDINFIDKDPKVVGDMPAVPRMNDNVRIPPRTGDLLMFPSGAMHMVAPNLTDKERYSISFNFNVRLLDYTIGKDCDDMIRTDIKNLDNIWHIDDNGDYIY